MTKPFTERPDRQTGRSAEFQRLFLRRPPKSARPLLILLLLRFLRSPWTWRDRKNGTAACRECPFPRDDRATRERTLARPTWLARSTFPPPIQPILPSALFHSRIASHRPAISRPHAAVMFFTGIPYHTHQVDYVERGRGDETGNAAVGQKGHVRLISWMDGRTDGRPTIGRRTNGLRTRAWFCIVRTRSPLSMIHTIAHSGGRWV